MVAEIVAPELAENDTLIEEMLKISPAPEPGAEDGNVVHKGDEDVPMPMVSSLTSAGWVYVWDTRTYERSIVNRNMLSSTLGKKRADGSRVFTTQNPGKTPGVAHLNVCCILIALGGWNTTNWGCPYALRITS